MPGGASLAYKTYLTNGAHPDRYGLVHLLLMINIALRIRKCLGRMDKIPVQEKALLLCSRN